MGRNFLRLPARKDNAGEGKVPVYLGRARKAATFFGIMIPDSRLMGCNGAIAWVVMPVRMTTLFFFGYSFMMPPFRIWISASPAGKAA